LLVTIPQLLAAWVIAPQGDVGLAMVMSVLAVWPLALCWRAVRVVRASPLVR